MQVDAASTAADLSGSRNVLVVQELEADDSLPDHQVAPGPAAGSLEGYISEQGFSNSDKSENTDSGDMGKGSEDVPDTKVHFSETQKDKKRNEVNVVNAGENGLVGVGNGGARPGQDQSQSQKKHRGIAYLGETRVVKKLVFLVSVITLAVLSCSLVSSHWLLPYYYTVSTPILLLIRLIMYWKYKWQFFLIDFCYFGNVLSYVFIWAAPDNINVFLIMFGSANGPMAWAIPIFRNSIVFHSTDKMTSIFIHTLPLFLTYSIRWFPSSVSLYWYKPFLSQFSEDPSTMFVWGFAIPYGCYIANSVFTILTVHVICKPGPKYLYTYNYFKEKQSLSGCYKRLGPKLWPVAFYGANWLGALLTMLFSLLFYKYFIAHTIGICFFLLMGIWNGSSYYMDKIVRKEETTGS